MRELSIEKKCDIENIVNDILHAENLSSSIPVDIVPLVKRYGFLVQTADLPIETTGYLLVNEEEEIDEKEKCHKLIVVNNKFKNKSKEDSIVLKKSRFITAHEFGHYILHRKKNESIYAHRDSDKRETPMELEADYFARSILMPAKSFLKLNKIIDEVINEDAPFSKEEKYNFKIEYLSKLFKVTKDKVKKRMGDIEVLTSVKVQNEC